MSNTMTFKLDGSGNLSLVDKSIISEIENIASELIFNHDKDNEDKFFYKLSKFSKKSKNKIYSVAPLPMVFAITGDIGGTGIFWDAFMKYIFPYMLDIAKVFCAIKIAQAFYQERRGGREGGSGVEAIVTYGKFYLLFALMPWAVELLDELGTKMLNDLGNE